VRGGEGRRKAGGGPKERLVPAIRIAASLAGG
jgi:hypothetical protein